MAFTDASLEFSVDLDNTSLCYVPEAVRYITYYVPREDDTDDEEKVSPSPAVMRSTVPTDQMGSTPADTDDEEKDFDLGFPSNPCT